MLGNIVKRPHCLACSNSIPIKGYNTLGDLHPELLKYFVDSEDAFKVLPHTRKDLRLKCPDCGSIKTMRGIDLIKRGFSCAVCSDKISYPNKFLRNFSKTSCIAHQCTVYNDYSIYSVQCQYAKKKSAVKTLNK